MLSWLMAAALAFPDIQARDLDGKAVTGRSLAGRPTAVLLGFSYESRTAVEAWTRLLVKATRSELPVIVMPVYPAGMPGPIRSWVDGQLAGHTEGPLRRYVWTTTDRSALVQGLGLTGREDTVALLLDAGGQVRCVERGAPSTGSSAEFVQAWQALRGGKP
jgi:hypothetical protein